MPGNYSLTRNNLWEINSGNLLLNGLESATPSTPIGTSIDSLITLVTMYSLGTGASGIDMDKVLGGGDLTATYSLPVTNALWTNSVSPWVIRYENASYTFSDEASWNNSTTRTLVPIMGHLYHISFSAFVSTSGTHAAADVTSISEDGFISTDFYDAGDEDYLEFSRIPVVTPYHAATYPCTFDSIFSTKYTSFGGSGWVYIPNTENIYRMYPKLQISVAADTSLADANMKLRSLNYTVLDYGTAFNALVGT